MDWLAVILLVPAALMLLYRIVQWRRAIRDEEQSGTHYLGVPVKTDKRVPEDTILLKAPTHNENPLTPGKCGRLQKETTSNQARKHQRNGTEDS